MDRRRPLSIRILGWVLGDHSGETFEPFWNPGNTMEMLFLCDGWLDGLSYLCPDEDQIISKTYMTRVEGENTRLRHYLGRLNRKTLCYSNSTELLRHSIRLLIHYLKFGDVPIPYQNERNYLGRM